MFLYKYSKIKIIIISDFFPSCRNKHTHTQKRWLRRKEEKQREPKKKLRVCQQMFYITYQNYRPRIALHLKISNFHSIFIIIICATTQNLCRNRKKMVIFCGSERDGEKKLIKIFLWKIYSGAWILNIVYTHI